MNPIRRITSVTKSATHAVVDNVVVVATAVGHSTGNALNHVVEPVAQRVIRARGIHRGKRNFRDQLAVQGILDLAAEKAVNDTAKAAEKAAKVAAKTERKIAEALAQEEKEFAAHQAEFAKTFAPPTVVVGVGTSPS